MGNGIGADLFGISIHVAAIIEAFCAFTVAGVTVGAVLVKRWSQAAKRFVMEVITPELVALRKSTERTEQRVARLEDAEAGRGLNVQSTDVTTPTAHDVNGPQ